MSTSKSTARRTAPRRPRASRTNPFLKAVLTIKAEPALMTHEQLQEAQTRHRADPYGMVRQVAFGVLTVSGAELIEKVGQSRETAQNMVDVLQDLEAYIAQEKTFVQLLHAAQIRCMVALAYRDDSDQLHATASSSQQDVAT